MNRIILVALAALSLGLTACETTGGINDPPLASTQVDEQAIALAFETADTVRAMVGELREAEHPCCVPGTAAAQTMASRLETLADVLRGASSAQRLGNSAEALQKLNQARGLITAIRSTIGRTSP